MPEIIKEVEIIDEKSPKNITRKVYNFFLKECGGIQLNVRTGNLETIKPRKELRGINHIGAILMEQADINIPDVIIKRILAYFREEWLSRTYDPVKEYLQSVQQENPNIKADWLKGKAKE